jgi:hypothetical protein
LEAYFRCRHSRSGSGSDEGDAAAMIPIPSGVHVWIATGHTDMRRGMNGLKAGKGKFQPRRHCQLVDEIFFVSVSRIALRTLHTGEDFKQNLLSGTKPYFFKSLRMSFSAARYLWLN